MKYLRLWFLALLVAAVLRDKPLTVLVEDVQPHKPDEWLVIEGSDLEPEAAPPLPEPTEWFSFLNQETGIWNK